MPDSVTSLGKKFVAGCTELREIVVPDGVTQLWDVFGESAIEKITLSEKITIIGEETFKDCVNLKCVIMLGAVTEIRASAFEGSGIESIELPNTITYISQRTFANCANLKSVVVPESVATVGDEAFAGCTALDGITLRGVKKIGIRAFSGCAALERVTVAATLNDIGTEAFTNCTQLSAIDFSGTKMQWDLVRKGNFWNRGAGEYTVTCSDGIYGE